MKIKKIFVLTLLSLGFFTFQFAGAPNANAGLFDDAKNQACNGARLEDSGGCGSANGDGLNKTITMVINILSVVVGIVAVVMIIISGLKFVTSGGDANKVSSAKSGVIYAIVGIVIVVLAQFVVKYIIKNVG